MKARAGARKPAAAVMIGLGQVGELPRFVGQSDLGPLVDGR
jgi:hypothetical protein